MRFYSYVIWKRAAMFLLAAGYFLTMDLVAGAFQPWIFAEIFS